MKIANEIKLLAALLVFLLLAVLAGNYWHSIPLQPNETIAAALVSYPYEIQDNAQACFSLLLMPENLPAERTVEILAYANGQAVENKKIAVLNEDVESNTCFDSGILQEGENKIEIYAGASHLFFHLQKGAEERRVELSALEQKPKTSNFNPLGLLLIALSVAVFALFVFSSRGLLEKFALSLAFSTILVMAIAFALSLLLAFNAFNFAVSFLIANAAIAVAFAKKLKLNYARLNFRDLYALEVLAIVFIIAGALFFNVFTQNHLSYWTSFYERESELVASAHGIPLSDPLSYLGEKPFGFMSGYFFINSGFSFLTGLEGAGNFALLSAFAKIFFLISALFFFSAIFPQRNKRILAFILTCFAAFMLADLMFNVRHVFSYALFLLGIGMLIKNRGFALPGILIGFAAFVQTPLLIMFPLAYWMVCSKPRIRALAKSFAIACAFALALFAPVLLNAGIPSQARPEKWGYLTGMPLYGILIDLLALIVFFLLFFAPDAIKKQLALNAYSKKLAIAVVIGVLIELFISYRFNIITAILFASFLAEIFPEDKLKEIFTQRALCALFALGIAVALIVIAGFSAPIQATNAAGFLAEFTAQDSSVLSDQQLGHTITYFGRRKVLADLAVEYAPQEKLDDAARFLRTKDYSILEKYGIDYIFAPAKWLNENVIETRYLHEPLEFDALDKIYANEEFFIHRVR
ncbi:MAG: hypothetical protein HYW05_05580 [Candidatus Diapherotrites archaeon]|nr:hypothetical protein [Candidatus Diapherotrites archaeon]